MSPPPGNPRDVALRTGLWLLLGGWVGAWIFFGAVVSRVAFTVLPSTELAGTLIGPVLESLQWYGAGAGIALMLLTLAMGRGIGLALVPLAMGLACLFSHIVVTAEIAELRDLAFGPDGNTGAAARFNLLHRVSVGVFIAVGVASLVLLWLHARADSRAARVG
jgi:hypothetical protein